MKKMDFQKVIEWLSFVLKCPVCNYKYNLEHTKIVDTRQENVDQAVLVVHSDCTQCKSSVVFSISINGPEVFSVGMLSDLTSSDSDKFVDKEPITADEVLALHQTLNTFDGNLVKLLQK